MSALRFRGDGSAGGTSQFPVWRAVLAFFVTPVTSDGHPVMPIGHVAGYFAGRVR